MTSISLIRSQNEYDSMIESIVSQYLEDNYSRIESCIDSSPYRHECNHLYILAFSSCPDAINEAVTDTVQVHIINGLDGLLASMAFYAILHDCEKTLAKKLS